MGWGAAMGSVRNYVGSWYYGAQPQAANPADVQGKNDPQVQGGAVGNPNQAAQAVEVVKVAAAVQATLAATPAVENIVPIDPIRVSKQENPYKEQIETVLQYIHFFQTRSIQFYHDITSTPESQRKVLTVAKSIFEIVTLYYGNYGPAFGAVFAAWTPKWGKRISVFVNELVSDALKGKSFEQQMSILVGSSVTVIGTNYLWPSIFPPILPFICSVYTVKIGIECTFNNAKFFGAKLEDERVELIALKQH